MTPAFNENWEARDSESIVHEFEHYFYSPDPNTYSIEGSHAVFSGSSSQDQG